MQATKGDNTAERPMWAEKGGLDFDGRAKWDAWTAVKGMKPEKAKLGFVKARSSQAPGPCIPTSPGAITFWRAVAVSQQPDRRQSRFPTRLSCLKPSLLTQPLPCRREGPCKRHPTGCAAEAHSGLPAGIL